MTFEERTQLKNRYVELSLELEALASIGRREAFEMEEKGVCIPSLIHYATKDFNQCCHDLIVDCVSEFCAQARGAKQLLEKELSERVEKARVDAKDKNWRRAPLPPEQSNELRNGELSSEKFLDLTNDPDAKS